MKDDECESKNENEVAVEFGGRFRLS